MEEHKKATPPFQSPFAQSYFHGTKADLQLGDFIEP